MTRAIDRRSALDRAAVKSIISMPNTLHSYLTWIRFASLILRDWRHDVIKIADTAFTNRYVKAPFLDN